MCVHWVDFDSEWWRVGSPGGRTAKPASLWRARIGCVWKTECSMWNAEAGDGKEGSDHLEFGSSGRLRLGGEAKMQWSLRMWNPVDSVAGFRSRIDGKAEM